MLGASIQAIDNFCKLTSQKYIKDKCSLIGFNDKSKVVISGINMEENEQITNVCLSNLCPDGGTNFYNAFKESCEILKVIDRNQFIPVIILLTDGLDHSFDKTKPFVDKVSKY